MKKKGERVSPAKSNRGRPIVHTEPWAKITVVLLDRHVAYLDRLAIDIRLKHGKAISRAEIIRGLIEAAGIRMGARRKKARVACTSAA